jgi:hypothetical protein
VCLGYLKTNTASRILAFIPAEVTQLYKTLVNVFDVNKFGPNRTFNIDKNGLSVGQKPSAVINPRAPKQVWIARNIERDRNIT